MDILKGLYKEFDWFIWALVIIGVVWFFTGGADRQVAHEGAFLKPLAPIDSGRAYGTYYAGNPANQTETLNLPQGPANIVRSTETAIADFVDLAKKAAQIHNTSLASNGLIFDGVAGAQASGPNAEYIRIVASQRAPRPIDITGLILTGTTNDGILIPQAVGLPLVGNPGSQSDVYLAAGDRALITTGASPVGYSFRINECTGYWTSAYAFTPALLKECPDGSGCVTDASKDHTYNQCVSAHLDDKNFYTDEWRLFLGQKTQLWQDSNEIITLKNSKGTILDEITY